MAYCLCISTLFFPNHTHNKDYKLTSLGKSKDVPCDLFCNSADHHWKKNNIYNVQNFFILQKKIYSTSLERKAYEVL